MSGVAPPGAHPPATLPPAASLAVVALRPLLLARGEPQAVVILLDIEVRGLGG